MSSGPILMVNQYSFELEQGFTDGYLSKIRPLNSLKFRSHPSDFIWEGGEFKPLNIEINLAVGIQSIVSTPDKLVDIITEFYKFALPPNSSGYVVPKPVTVKVGTWFRRDGYVLDLDVTYQEPWDSETGKPLRAILKFMLMADFMPNKKKSTNLKELPNSGNWNMKYVGTGGSSLRSGKPMPKASSAKTGGS